MIEYINIELNIDNNEHNILEKHKQFLKDLNNLYKSFLNKKKCEEDKWDKEKLKIYVPEKIRYASPITIFDAPWGSGKTYFFEELMFNSIGKDHEIDFKDYDFKKVILIDLWEYIGNENAVDNLVIDIVNRVLSKMKKIKYVTKELSKKAVSSFLEKIGSCLLKKVNISLKSVLNFIQTPSIEIFNNKDNKVNKLIKEFKKIKPTILIIDNLERMGDKTVQIIKIIQKLSCLNNLIIILPLNLNKLYLPFTISDNSKNNMDFIEKYITLDKYFKFSQDYYSFLKNKGLDDECAKDLNIFIKFVYKEEMLSIRDLDKKINSKNVNEINNDYKFNELYALWHFGNNVLINDNTNLFIKNFLTKIVKDICLDINKFLNEYKDITQLIKYFDFSSYPNGQQIINIINSFYLFKYFYSPEGYKFYYQNFLKFLENENLIKEHMNLFRDFQDKVNIFDSIDEINHKFIDIKNKWEKTPLYFNIIKNLYDNKLLDFDNAILHNNREILGFDTSKLVDQTFDLIINKEFK